MNDEPNAGPQPGPDASTRTDDLDSMLHKEGAYIPKGDPDPAPGGGGEGVSVDTAEAATSLLLISFNMLLAPMRGEHWKLDEDAAREAGRAYGALIDKYYPDMKIGKEAAAISVTVALLGPRVALDIAAARQQAAAAAEKAQQDQADEPADLDEPGEGEGTDAGQA